LNAELPIDALKQIHGRNHRTRNECRLDVGIPAAGKNPTQGGLPDAAAAGDDREAFPLVDGLTHVRYAFLLVPAHEDIFWVENQFEGIVL